MKKNIFYAQSGGVTAVINATACGLIEAARENKKFIGKVYAGHYGILGALQENLIDTSRESAKAIRSLLYTPGSAFGSCRYKLNAFDKNQLEYKRIIEVFRAHDIGYFFYNGGNDSQDTAHKISEVSQTLNYPLVCIGIPKTIDNDLAITDNCPGFGSAAKYIATSIQEAAWDVASMAASSTKIFVMEVMGRHHGWLAAAAGLGAINNNDAPHLILFPEILFNETKFLEKVKKTIETIGYCVIVVSEGLCNTQGDLLVESAKVDAFGHRQLGGIAPVITDIITRNLSYKCHYAVCDYLQRSARHIASQTDLEQAYALGSAAIDFALAGEKNIMLTIQRKRSHPYRWRIGTTPLSSVANHEKALPRSFIDAEGWKITEKCRNYLLPLIQGEAYPPYQKGLPDYKKYLKRISVKKKLIA